MKKKYRIYPAEYPLSLAERWAVSEEEAVKDYWWTECKKSDPFTITDYKPSDFVAVQM